MNPISKVENGLINPDDRIFEILANDPPTWWMIAKKDPELYIEIRKYNEIMIYYNGGRAAGIKYSKRKNCLEVTAHPKYLGHKDNTDLTYYKDNDKHTPIYQPCEDWLENKLEELKKKYKNLLFWRRGWRRHVRKVHSEQINYTGEEKVS